MSLQPWTCYDFEFYSNSWKTFVGNSKIWKIIFLSSWHHHQLHSISHAPIFRSPNCNNSEIMDPIVFVWLGGKLRPFLSRPLFWWTTFWRNEKIRKRDLNPILQLYSTDTEGSYKSRLSLQISMLMLISRAFLCIVDFRLLTLIYCEFNDFSTSTVRFLLYVAVVSVHIYVLKRLLRIIGT